MSDESNTSWKSIVTNWTVMVAALGYFVDMFDIALFGVVRMQSLNALGITDPAETLKVGAYLYNMQMYGLMLGGLLWGVIADKKGRLIVMFGSILLYSVGNIANAFVVNVEQYAWCRLITGIGLAGELGAAITIVAESLPARTRGMGTTLVATLGMFGILAAALVGKYLHWQTAYLIGGGMGLLLLFARFRIAESGLFDKMKSSSIERGSVLLLLKQNRWVTYLACIVLGAPIYFITGILFIFAPEIAKGVGVTVPVSAVDALLWGSLGLALGDLKAGILSQKLNSRKKAVGYSLILALAMIHVYLFVPVSSAAAIYVLCFVLGLAAGYWAVLVTMAAEQFGTNLRGTVATSVPNFVRGTGAITTTLVLALRESMELRSAVWLVAMIWFALAFLALWHLKETFGKKLDFYEE